MKTMDSLKAERDEAEARVVSLEGEVAVLRTALAALCDGLDQDTGTALCPSERRAARELLAQDRAR